MARRVIPLEFTGMLPRRQPRGEAARLGAATCRRQHLCLVPSTGTVPGGAPLPTSMTLVPRSIYRSIARRGATASLPRQEFIFPFSGTVPCLPPAACIPRSICRKCEGQCATLHTLALPVALLTISFAMKIVVS